MNKNELKKLEAIAGSEFNYEGEEHYGSSGANHSYIGERNEYDFGGNGNSFVAEHATGRTFSFIMENTSDDPQVVALCPGYYDSLARLSAEGHSDVTAIFGDGDIFTGANGVVNVVSQNAGKTIFGLLEFIKRHPLRVIGMSIQTNDPGQLDEIIRIENISPFYSLGNKQIVLSRFRPASQLATDKIEANLIKTGQVIDMNDQNLVKFPIRSGAKVTINLYIGAIDNNALKLKRKADMAHENIRRVRPDLCQ